MNTIATDTGFGFQIAGTASQHYSEIGLFGNSEFGIGIMDILGGLDKQAIADNNFAEWAKMVVEKSNDAVLVFADNKIKGVVNFEGVEDFISNSDYVSPEASIEILAIATPTNDRLLKLFEIEREYLDV